ncbi:hypothetical protein [Halarcobacter sp.]|uniref:YkgJ family cysteine cluster protein n=1 Tax=Halarcobacter sp. TaxID=2321133 RepID=UPI0029F4F4F5|nr:hypothetical protein [Halarcobacter sp.]
MFKLLDEEELYFGDCKDCHAKCCDGREGIVFSQILLDEFEYIYKNFPIVFIFGGLNYIKPVVLLTNGKSLCPYNIDFKCTIYEKRPSVCRIYPLSTNLDNQIYIDKDCPQVTLQKENKTPLSKNKKLSPYFQNDIFYTYQEKYIETHYEFDILDKNDFKEIINIKSMPFYGYFGSHNSKYIDFHKYSLVNLNKYI